MILNYYLFSEDSTDYTSSYGVNYLDHCQMLQITKGPYEVKDN